MTWKQRQAADGSAAKRLMDERFVVLVSDGGVVRDSSVLRM